MDLTAKSGALVDEFSRASRVASKKDVIPALQYVLLESSGMNELTMTATDTEIATRATCPLGCVEPGAVLLPAKRMADLLRLWGADEEVRIQTDKKGVRVTAGAYDGRIQTFDVREFPTLPEVPGERSPLPLSIRAMIAKIEFAIADNDRRYWTAGALLHLKEGRAVMVATDGYRMCHVSTAVDTPADVKMLISKRALPELSALLDGQSEASVAVDTPNGKLFFVTPTCTLITSMVEGKFPNYERNFAVDLPHRAVGNRDQLLAAIRRVWLTVESTDRRMVAFAFGPDRVVVSGEGSVTGNASEPVAMEYSGPAVTICLRGDFVLQFLNATSAGMIAIDLASAESPVVLSQADESEFTYKCAMATVRA